MFNLIITIIAIALVVVLTATSVFYGGDAFSEGSTDAIAATYINQAQQVQGAATLFKAKTGAEAGSVGELKTEKYLSSIPTSPANELWAIEDGTEESGATFIVTTAEVKSNNEAGISPEVCAKINANGSGLVLCGTFDGDFSDEAALTSGTVSVTETATTAFVGMAR